ncbi:nicotinate-nucleotide--dimethylbenzimidazole phosphoribosyltransferase [Streptomyces rishiriensis]|uniref:nicotinate-nucleotide--dimethylbenzimidazole phosphoribosyltransferase n=1 Tax=Streptomyces rishiriensis TaxID=68264 RepID=UPI0037D1EA9F
MTDTGQVPGEGLPESAGMVEQPGAPAHGAYTYLSETTAEDEDLLLLPGAQSAWGNEVAPPAPEPVVEAVHEPGPHETAGRDSGSVDLSGVRLPGPSAPQATPRRPLHLGPPIPDASASPVRSLADRGPAGVPVRQPGPPTTGPEYLDVQHLRDMPPQGASPWGAALATAQATVQASAPAQVASGGTAGETVVPAAVAQTQQAEPVGAAQAVVARVATEAIAATAPQEAHEPEAAQEPRVARGYGIVDTGELLGAAMMAEAQEDPADEQTADAPPAAVEPPVEAAQAPETVEGPEAAPARQSAAAHEAAEPAQPAQPAEAAEPVPADVVDATEAVGGAAVETAVPVPAETSAAVPVPAAAGDAVAEPAVAEDAVAGPVVADQAVADAGGTAAPNPAEEPQESQQQEPQESQEPQPVAALADPSAQGPQTFEAAEAPETEAVTTAAVVPGPDSVADVPSEPAPSATPAPGLATTPEPTTEPVPGPEAVQAPEPPQAVNPEAPEPAASAEETPAEQVFEVSAPESAPEPVISAPTTEADAPAPAVTPEDVATVVAAESGPQAEPLADHAAQQAAGEPELEPEPEPSAEAADEAPVPVAHAVQTMDAASHTPDADGSAPDVSLPDASPAPEPEAAPVAMPGLVQPEPAASLVQPSAEASGTAETADTAGTAELPQASEPAGSPVEAAPAPLVVPETSVPLAAEAPPAEHPQAVQPAVAHLAPTADEPDAGLPHGEPPLAPVSVQPGPDQPIGPAVPVEGTVSAAEHPVPAPAPAPTPPPAAVAPASEHPASEHPAPEQAAPEQAADEQSADEQSVDGQSVEAEAQPVEAQAVEAAVLSAAAVPAPRAADPVPAPATPDAEHENDVDPDVAQSPEDLQTRAADQEESPAAAVEEARESTGPAAPAYDDAERAAVLKVMRERRDIRNGFRSDPIPHEVLLRVLEAAHTAPSVGHSQPWDFVVIRSADTRRAMHELATRQRDAYAKSLPKGRAKQFKELKIEAILDTPVNIVVTADPTRGGRHTLGRHTQPQMAPYSSALAVENLWLAARAEGLGVGWVSFFDEREMVRALGLPEHLEVVAYLCVGYVDEFPDEPELMQAGWAKRRPLSWVVHEETYGRRALPGEDPHDLLAETVASVRPLDAKALGEAWERQKRMTKPAGALGMLEIISAQLSGLSRQCPPPIPEPAAVAIFAGDHGVHAQGVTPWPQEVTAQMVANFLGGGAVCNAFATQVGAEVCVVDVGVAADLPGTPGLLPRKIRAGTSDMTTGPAMTREEAKQAIEVGIETARDLVAAGNKALLTGEMGIANTTASAALISVFTGADPAEVTGRGTGINDETLARKTEVVRRALDFHQPDPADPIGVLAAIGGFEHAAMVGLLLGGASLRTPVILDGVSAGAAALVARAIAPEVLAACIAGHRSAEPGHVAALNKLGLRPLVDLDLRLGEGTGALLALPLVQSTARAMHEVATFDSAGVTEK